MRNHPTTAPFIVRSSGPSSRSLPPASSAIRIMPFERIPFQFARREIYQYEHLPAHQFLRCEMFGDARHDFAAVYSRIDGQLQQLFRLGDLLGRKDRRNANIHPAEFIERYIIFLFFNILRILCRCIRLLRGHQFVELAPDRLVLDLLEQQFGLRYAVARSDQIRATQLLPAELPDREHVAYFPRRERHERFDGDRRIGCDLKCRMEDGTDPLGIGLDEFPRFGIGQILIADTGRIHRILERLAEVVGFDVVFERCLDAAQLGQRLPVVGIELAAGGTTPS